MIVWNVDTQWFALKAEAENHRRDLKLKPDATRRAEIVTREQLATLLNHGAVSLPAAIPKLRKVDPRQIDMFEAGDTAAGLAAIKAAIGVADNAAELPATTAATEPEKPADLSTAAISTGDEREPPDDDGRPIERTPQAFDEWQPGEPDEKRMVRNADGDLYDLETGEIA